MLNVKHEDKHENSNENKAGSKQLVKLHYIVIFQMLYCVVTVEKVTSCCNICLLQHNVTLSPCYIIV